MGRITKRLVEAAHAEAKDYFIWGNELPGFGVRIVASGKRSYLIRAGRCGTAASTIGLLEGILTYAVEGGIIETNPAFGIRKPKDNVRDRRLSEAEYRLIGTKLREAEGDGQYPIAAQIIRMLALAGCRRSELTQPRAGYGRRLLLANNRLAAFWRASGKSDIRSPPLFSISEMFTPMAKAGLLETPCLLT